MKIPRFVWIGAGIVILAVIGLIIYGDAQRDRYLVARGQADVLRSEYSDYRATAERLRDSLTAEAETLRAARLAAIEQALAAELARDRIAADLIAAQAQTAALPPDALVSRINQRIGDGQSWPTGGGLFSFTRPGTEAVLNRFLKGEAAEGKYEAESNVSAGLRSALFASESETANVAHRLLLTTGELTRAVAAWEADRTALRHLERSITGRQLKAAAVGAGIGAAAVLIFQLAKGK